MAVCACCEREMTTGAGCDPMPVECAGRSHERVLHRRRSSCSDCGVRSGSYHHPGCDLEPCPRCGRQLISCGCLDEPDEEPDPPEIDTIIARSPWLQPLAESAAAVRHKHRETLAELIEWVKAHRQSVDLDCAAVVLQTIDEALNCVHRPPVLQRPDVHSLLRAAIPTWCTMHRTLMPKRLAHDMWTVLVFLADTGRLPVGSDPLDALLDPLDCYAGIAADGRRRRSGERPKHACRCYEPYCPDGEMHC